MNLTESIILLLVGAAVFIVGMNFMSNGLRKACGKGIRNLLKKIQNKALASIGIGTGVTALIQSSAATSVMTIGFINAGAITVFQGVCIVLGAYLGTTITGVLASLSSFNFSMFFVLFAVVGVILMFFKKKNIKTIGEILTGLGLLFFGLSSMSRSFKDGAELLNAIQTMFKSVSFPLLLLLIGMLFTALVQSSSATSGIVIVLVQQQALSLQSGFYIVLGATIGTIITTVLATIGGNTDSKRMTFVCFLDRLVCALVAMAIIWPLGNIIPGFFKKVFVSDGFAIAMFLVFYNLVFIFLVLPLIKPAVNLANKIIKDKDEEKLKKTIKYIDDRLLDTPSIAMMQLKKEIKYMMDLAESNYRLGYNRIITQNKDNDKLIIENEAKIDYINNFITDFLIKLSNKVDRDDAKVVGSYFHVINDIERIGDHAYNFYEESLQMVEKDLSFSDVAKKELDSFNKTIEEMFNVIGGVFLDKPNINLELLKSLENDTDILKDKYASNHFNRITKNECNTELSPFYSTLLSELERVADHLTNIGYSQVNPTGDEQVIAY